MFVNLDLPLLLFIKSSRRHRDARLFLWLFWFLKDVPPSQLRLDIVMLCNFRFCLLRGNRYGFVCVSFDVCRIHCHQTTTDLGSNLRVIFITLPAVSTFFRKRTRTLFRWCEQVHVHLSRQYVLLNINIQINKKEVFSFPRTRFHLSLQVLLSKFQFHPNLPCGFLPIYSEIPQMIQENELAGAVGEIFPSQVL